jgi:hypothetical protein
MTASQKYSGIKLSIDMVFALMVFAVMGVVNGVAE